MSSKAGQPTSESSPGQFDINVVDRPVLVATIVIVSVAMLMFEIFQTIILSLQLFHQNAFLVVSMSMLGLGSGGSIATLVTLKKTKQSPILWLWLTAMGFGLAIVVSMLISSRIHSVPGLIVAGLFPYLFLGYFLASVFFHWPGKVNRNYCFNLAGSGLGCLLLVWLLDGIADAGALIIVVAEISILGSVLLSSLLSRRLLAASVISSIVIAGLLPFTSALFPFSPNPTKKRYGVMLSDSEIDTSLLWSKWGYLGRLDSVRPVSGIQKFVYGGHVKEILDNNCDYIFLFANGDNWSFMVDFRKNRDYEAEYVRRNVLSSPYGVVAHHTKNPDVLNIGTGGGVDVFLALRHDAASVVGVEINPLMISAVRDIFTDYFDDPFHDPRVTVKELDARTFVNISEELFDVVTLSAVDTGAGLAHGANLLSENYLYTQEAFDRYFEILNEDGVLFLFRPFDQLFRSIVTAVESLRKRGVDQPEKHVVVLGQDDLDWYGAIISRSPLSQTQIEALESQADKGYNGGRLYYAPYSDRIDRDKNIQDMLVDYFRAVQDGDEREFIRDLQRNYAPVHDDKPYYYDMSKTLRDSVAFDLLVYILSWVAAVGAALIILPLVYYPVKTPKPRLAITGFYFLSIGIGFMFIEICLIQKLVLFLGHPVYSISVTLFSILIFSGLGSMYSSRFSSRPKRAHGVIYIAIILAAIAYGFLLNVIMSANLGESLLLRSIAVAVLLIPGSFFMGMPFPFMIRFIGDLEKPYIPWFCAINSFSSVAASVIAIMISMIFGFIYLLLFGALFYAIALSIYLYKFRLSAVP